jgi:hypothetical protein
MLNSREFLFIDFCGRALGVGGGVSGEESYNGIVCPLGICVGQSGAETGLSCEYFGFYLSVSFHICAIFIH